MLFSLYEFWTFIQCIHLKYFSVFTYIHVNELTGACTRSNIHILSFLHLSVTSTAHSFFVMDSTTESQYSVSPAPGEALKFDTIKSAFGEGYNVTEGKYVIPVSGNYVFTFGVVVIEGIVTIKLKDNDGVILEQNGKSVSGSIEVVTGTVVISRATGTEVYIHVERLSPTGLILIDKCWFAGWLINVSDTEAGP